MLVSDVMKREVAYCRPDDTLAAAAHRMSEVCCGVLPVVAQNEKVIGVITDRDISLALARDDRRPSEVKVADAMSFELFVSRPRDEIRTALRTMRQNKVRRLPVVDDSGRLAGILSLDDLVLRAEFVGAIRYSELSTEDVARTLKSIYARPEPVGVH